MNGLPSSSSRSAAFSLAECIIAVAVIGILAAVASQQFRGDLVALRDSKLEADVAALNRSVRLYLASGGSLAGVADSQAVICKLKSVRKRDSADTYVGFKGSMLDGRCKPVYQSTAESATRMPRAVWDPSKLAFEVRDTGPQGIARFDWDAAEAAPALVEEDRDSGSVKYNASDGWIWAYQDTESTRSATPLVLHVVSTGGSSIPPPRPAPQRLLPPRFLTAPGTFSFADFPTTVALENPNPEGASTLYVATTWEATGVHWEPYAGPVAVAPGMQILAYAAHASEGYSDSAASGGVYVRQEFRLSAPEIVTSAPHLDLETNEVVTVELVDTNPAFAKGNLEWSINHGGYSPYPGSFSVSPASYSAGFVVEARCVAATDGLLPSPEVSRMLPVKLRKPSIVTGTVVAGQTEPVPVTLTNTNPDGCAVLLYALRDLRSGTLSAYQPYSGAVGVSPAKYPKGFSVMAYANPLGESHLRSDDANSLDVTFFGVSIKGPVLFVLDCSGSMAWEDGLGQVKAEMGRVFDQFQEDDKFGIAWFSSYAELLVDWTSASSSAVGEARLAVEGLSPGGYTDYSAALSMALGMVQSREVTQVVFLSDGAPTAGDTSREGILSMVSQIVAGGTRVDTLAYGQITPEGRALLEEMDAVGDIQD